MTHLCIAVPKCEIPLKTVCKECNAPSEHVPLNFFLPLVSHSFFVQWLNVLPRKRVGKSVMFM